MPEPQRPSLSHRLPNVWLQTLRRFSWFWLHLVIATLLVFATAGRSGDGQVPLFINSNPVYIGTRTWQLVDSIGSEGPTSERAAEELLGLGGATLPFILPKLDSLQPAARLQLWRALAPLAVRMQLVTTAPTPEHSEALWLSFWNDHFVDFHPAMARRVVRRFVQGPSAARAQEVRRLDTFALGELVHELVRLSRERAPEAATKPVTDLMCTIAADAHAPCAGARREPVEEASALAERWRTWWQREHHRFESPSGTERFLAPILQTEYASWVRTSVRMLVTGRVLRSVPWRQCLLTTLQFALTVSVALWVCKLAPRLRQTWRQHRRLLGAPLWIGLCLPVTLLFALGTGTRALGYGGIGVLAGASVGIWSALYAAVVPTRWTASTAVYPHVSFLLGVVLAGENLCHVDGLGVNLVTAIQARDLQTAIWTTLGCAVLISAAHGLLGTWLRKPSLPPPPMPPREYLA